jgi:hypothetical protein
MRSLKAVNIPTRVNSRVTTALLASALVVGALIVANPASGAAKKTTPKTTTPKTTTPKTTTVSSGGRLRFLPSFVPKGYLIGDATDDYRDRIAKKWTGKYLVVLRSADASSEYRVAATPEEPEDKDGISKAIAQGSDQVDVRGNRAVVVMREGNPSVLWTENATTMVVVAGPKLTTSDVTAFIKSVIVTGDQKLPVTISKNPQGYSTLFAGFEKDYSFGINRVTYQIGCKGDDSIHFDVKAVGPAYFDAKVGPVVVAAKVVTKTTVRGKRAYSGKSEFGNEQLLEWNEQPGIAVSVSSKNVPLDVLTKVAESTKPLSESDYQTGSKRTWNVNYDQCG